MCQVRPVLCLGPLLVMSGCYKYVPATLESVPEGASVRAVISTEAQQRLWREARLELRELDGRLVEQEGERVLFEVRSARQGPARAVYQRVDLPRVDVLRVDVRRPDTPRTVALLGAAAAAATLVLVAALAEQNPGDTPPTNEPPPESRVWPLVRVPVITW